MFPLKKTIKAKWLADELNLFYEGKEDDSIHSIASSSKAQIGSLSFLKKTSNLFSGGVFICAETTEASNRILSNNPRLDFIKALLVLDSTVGFKENTTSSKVHSSVKIGKNVVVEDGVVIDENSIIEHNVVILKGTKIGKNCRIGSNSSIGSEGFGYERDQDGNPIKFVHLGGVVIGDNVEVGVNTCIARGTLGDTIIESNVKIDNLVQISHNCVVKKGAFIIACADLCGGVIVGENAWVAPNSSIKEKILIGDNSIVGLGAAVMKNVENNKIVAGNPARVLK